MADLPWYKTTYRLCQTNLSELDGKKADVKWWQEYWKKNHIQAVIINGGGIISYYPSKIKQVYRSRYLGTRDLLGEFVSAARELGIHPIARMDISGTTDVEVFKQNPDWFARDKSGGPIVPRHIYMTCINRSYFTEYVPQVFKEIIDNYHVDGFADNAWSSTQLDEICYCDKCRDRFKREVGSDLPEKVDWEDLTYLKWVDWAIKLRTENWEYFNKLTMKYGGPDCLWMGMLQPNSAGRRMPVPYDIREVTRNSRMCLCDYQRREELDGFEQNSFSASLMHGLIGWDKVVAECTANYSYSSANIFRQSAHPAEEVRYWMRTGIAGGISPWIHFIGSKCEDSRIYDTPVPIMEWHRENEQYLYNREPLSNIGMIWSTRNINFYGKTDARRRFLQPRWGMHHAMTRARIPFVPLHADDIAEQGKKQKVLVFPDVALLTDDQIKAVIKYVEGGGSLVVTGATGMLDEWGRIRQSFPLDEILGISRVTREVFLPKDPRHPHDSDYSLHNFMRLPETRHVILKGFERTNILGFNGQYYEVKARPGTEVVGTLVPPFLTHPPELAFIDEGKEDTGIPLLTVRETGFGGRVVYFAGDFDRRYGQFNYPDHGDLLANAIRWAAGDDIPIAVSSKGYLDCKIYQQAGRIIVHIVNLTGTHYSPGYVEEIYPVGPVVLKVKCGNLNPRKALLRVAKKELEVKAVNEFVEVTLDSIDAHEMIVFE